jgi:hypothetical protein
VISSVGEVGTWVGGPKGVLTIEVCTGPALVYREVCKGSGTIEKVHNNTTQQCDGKHMIQDGQSDHKRGVLGTREQTQDVVQQ